MNVLIVGASVTAFRLAQELMTRHQVVSIREDSGGQSGFEQLDIETVRGRATSADALKAGRVEHADVFIACTSSDEQNIVACLVAQKLGAKRTICVLTRPGFLSTADDEEDLADSLGIHVVVRPGEQLAQEIVRIITVPGALDVRVFAEGRVALLRYRVERGAPAAQAPLRSLGLPKAMNMVNVRRGDEMIVPKGNTRLREGDHVLAMGEPAALREFVGLLAPEQSRSGRDVVVIGAGRVGVSIASALERARYNVKLIEVDKTRCELAARRVKSMVLHGDGADLELLEQEQIADAAAVVCVTNNDEKNLLVSLLAKSLGVRRIITRADRISNERMFERVGVDVVLSKGGAAIRSVVLQLDQDHAEIRAELEHGSTCVIEVQLPDAFPPTQLSRLAPPEHAIVGAITRGRRVIIPGGNDELRPGDQLLVFCRTVDEEQAHAFFLEYRGTAEPV